MRLGARNGWTVDAFDGSSVAMKTCQRWAAEAGVEVRTHHADAFEFEGDAAGYDVVGLFYAHMPLTSDPHFTNSRPLAAPGGRVILEGFEPPIGPALRWSQG